MRCAGLSGCQGHILWTVSSYSSFIHLFQCGLRSTSWSETNGDRVRLWSGTINYTFYCNRPDAGTDITPGWNAKFDTTTDNPKTAYNACDSIYSVPGTYTAKVIAENGSTAAEDRATITVNQPAGPSAPSVTTTGATSITQGSATLGLAVNPNGADTTAWFDWGNSANFCCSTPHQGVGAGTTALPVSANIAGLSCGTTYYFRARAQNSAGGATPGGTLSFTTTSCVGGGSLSVSVAGTGTGRVVSSPSGIDCPGNCAASYSSGTQVLLSPSPFPGSTFSGWSGDADCTDGSVTMNGGRSCTATFTATSAAYTLSVFKAGSGTVSSADGGINCGGSCNYIYVAGTTVTLAASAGSGWSFSSWSGSCSGGPVVQLPMTGNMNCTANFTQNAQPTPVTTTGAATNVTDSSATLNGTINPENFAATAFFEYGPDPNLGNATPGIGFGPGNNSFFPYAQTVTGLACATNYRFRAVGVGAGGDYRASNNTFVTQGCPPIPCYSLNLIANPDNPVPIASPTNSSGCPFSQFHAGEHIALTVAAVPGDIVVGWNGTDNDSSTALINTLTMPATTQTVYAHFEHICYHLSLGYTGNGTVPVLTNPVPYCPTGYFNWGNEARVAASPATGWRIGGWTGTIDDTSTSDQNIIIMPTRDQAAFVQYVPLQYPLQVFPGGSGTGTIVSDLPGINCGPTCSASYPYGTTIILTAMPAIGSSLTAWSGSCAGGVVSFPPGGICYPTFTLTPTDFYALAPCRMVDTRTSQAAILSGAASPRSFQLAGICGIPATARAVAANVTIVNPTQPGYVTLFPADKAMPTASTLNFQVGQVRANNAILPLSADGRIAAILGPAVGGQVDLVLDVSGYFDAGTSVSLPTFAPKLDIVVGNEPLGLAIADFDGDHKPDVAVSLYGNGTGTSVKILRNTGTPGHLQFDAPFDVPTRNGPIGIATGDFDNDGKVDLVVANASSNTVTVIRNVSTPGSLSFQTILTLTEVGLPHYVKIADFDGDGRPDLIVTSNGGSFLVFHHAADPNTIAFDSRSEFTTESYLNQLAVADIDGDGRPDILVPIQNTNNLWIYQNTSSQGAVSAQAVPPFATGTVPEGIAVGYLKGDNRIDILVPSEATNTLAVFTNNSGPASPFSLSRQDLPTSAGPGAVAVGDLNHDGLPDVVVANGSANTITIFRNTSRNAVIDLTALPDLATALRPINVILGDVDGDGLLDIVVANHASQSISIFLNTTGHP